MTDTAADATSSNASPPQPRRRRARSKSSSVEIYVHLETDHVIGLVAAGLWRATAAALKPSGALHHVGSWFVHACGTYSDVLPSTSTVETLILGAFPIIPALACAALRDWRKLQYTKELTAFYAHVDPSELVKVRPTAEKLARLGPNAPAAKKKHFQTLARRHGVSPDKVFAEAEASGKPLPPLPERSPATPWVPADGRIQWGILGTADIARKNVVSMRLAKNAECAAIASRTLSKAQKFATDNGGIPKAYGSYDELLADPDIDAVYIPLPTALRKEWVLKAAAAGKHVLAEKPAGSSLADVEEMISACEQHGVLFMDGVMFMHHTRLNDVRSLLSTGLLGENIPSRVVAAFSFSGDPTFFGSNIRVDEREPLGCLGDLGWYTVRFALWLHEYKLPEKVMMVTHRKSDAGIPTDCSCTLDFGSGKTATFDVSFHQTLRQWVELAGTNATLRIPDFVIPSSTSEATCVVERWGVTEKAITFRREKREVLTTKNCNQHACMIEKFSQLVLGDDTKQFKEWSTMTLRTQEVLDALMASAKKDAQWVRLQDTSQ